MTNPRFPPFLNGPKLLNRMMSNLPNLIARWIGSSPIQFRGFGACEIGSKSPVNADVIRIHDELSLYLVADGFGPGALAKNASYAGASRFVEQFAELSMVHGHAESLSRTDQQARAHSMLHQSFCAAAIEVNRLRSCERPDASFGASLAALMCLGRQAYFASVGHCRGYRWRNGSLQQMTEDDTITAEWDRLEGESPDHSAFGKLLTSHLGDGETLKPHISSTKLRADDWLLLLTDGVYRTLDRDRLNELVASSPPENIAPLLIDSVRVGGASDDCAVAMVKVTSHSDSPIRVRRQKDAATELELDRLSRVPAYTSTSFASK